MCLRAKGGGRLGIEDWGLQIATKGGVRYGRGAVAKTENGSKWDVLALKLASPNVYVGDGPIFGPFPGLIWDALTVMPAFR